jgi:membrane protease YdiL (CAAX protease family)
VTRQQARKSASRTGGSQDKGHFALDPVFAGLIFAGVGLGTLALGTSPRLAVLWVALLVLWVAYREGKPIQVQYCFADVGRGVLIGLAVAIPLMLLAFRALVTAIPILFVSGSPTIGDMGSGTLVFVSVVTVAPLAEELFFRDMLQRTHGTWLGALFYAGSGVIFFLPTAGQFPVVLVAVVGVWSILGVMYSLFFERFGLATTLSCHAVINLTLLFVPAALSQMDLFAS